METGTPLLPPEAAGIIISSAYSIIIPVVATILAVGLIWAIVKLFIGKFVFSLSRMSGCTVRESKRNKKKAMDMVDLVSAVDDLNISKK